MIPRKLVSASRRKIVVQLACNQLAGPRGVNHGYCRSLKSAALQTQGNRRPLGADGTVMRVSES